MWVNTIVRIRPILRGDPVGEQRRDPGQEIGAEKDAAERGRLDGEAQVEPIGQQSLDDEAAAEGIEGEESAELEDRPFDRCSPKRLLNVVGAARGGASTAGESRAKSRPRTTPIPA